MSKGNYYLQDERKIVRKTEMPRCKTWVWLNGTPNDHQCVRPSVKDGHCKMHQPEAIVRRREKREARKAP